MKIFISHIHEEANIAYVLKDWIDRTFLGQCNIFVSSDDDNLPAGAKWLEEIDKALANARVLIVICSKRSVVRPWINFEVGCAWMKKIPIVPLCHTDLTKLELPSPWSAFQALEIRDEHFSELFFNSLAKYLEVQKLPPIHHQAFMETLSSALKLLESQYQEENDSTADVDLQDSLEQIEIAILKAICALDENEYDNDRYDKGRYSAEEIAYKLRKPIPYIEKKIAQMRKKDLLLLSTPLGGPFYFGPSEEAEKYTK